MKIKSLTVSRLNNYIKSIFSTDAILNNVSVEGEISNFKQHTSGHLYFVLKDENSRILCVMFMSNAEKLKFIPEDGKNVLIKGYVSLYEKSGQYQLYVQEMNLDGVGNLYIEFEKLKIRLQEKGWFEQYFKQEIPSFPKKIAIVTSQTGAAIRDIISVAQRRNPSVFLYIYPVLVQGENAKYYISRSLNQINEEKQVDLIILARGGGNIEELWAFNEEIVAESIFNSQIPVISGVGHETDFTIADFVADLRAPTPSAAAEIAIPSVIEIKSNLKNYKDNIYRHIIGKIQWDKNRLEGLKNHYIIKRPIDQLNSYRQELNIYETRLESKFKTKLQEKREKILKLKSNLIELTRQNNMVIVKDAEGTIMTSVKQIHKEKPLTIEFIDGSVKVKIVDINEEKYERKNI